MQRQADELHKFLGEKSLQAARRGTLSGAEAGGALQLRLGLGKAAAAREGVHGCVERGHIHRHPRVRLHGLERHHLPQHSQSVRKGPGP